MKRFFAVLLFVAVPVSVVFAQAEMLVDTPPALIEVNPKDADASMGPATYPVFSGVTSENAACNAYLMRTYDSSKPHNVNNGFSLAPICYSSPMPRANGWRAAATCPVEEVIQGLEAKDINIKEDFRSSGKMLVTWTVRVEGYKPDIQIPPMYAGNPGIHPNLCWGFHGAFTLLYPGGNVDTKLYVTANGVTKQMGQVFTIQVPDAGKISLYQAADPTLTGKYLLQASDFPDGKLPTKIDKIEIKWINKTPLKIVSKKGYRNLIVEFLPVGR